MSGRDNRVRTVLIYNFIESSGENFSKFSLSLCKYNMSLFFIPSVNELLLSVHQETANVYET